MTLRTTLLALIGLFGLTLAALATGLAWDNATTYRDSLAQSVQDADRRALAAVLRALAVHDLATAQGLPGDPARIEAAAATAIARFETAQDAETLALLRGIAREQVRKSGPALTPALLRATAGAPALPPGGRLSDPVLLAASALRDLCLLGFLHLAFARARIEARLADLRIEDHNADRDFILFHRSLTAAQTGMAATALRDTPLLSADATGTWAIPASRALSQIAGLYQPAESRLLDSLASGGPDTATLTLWREVSTLVASELAQASDRLDTAVATRLVRALADARNRMVAFAALALIAAALTALGARLALTRIILPHERLRSRLDLLGSTDHAGPALTAPCAPDMAALHRIVDDLSQTAGRRARMQAELARLGDRVVSDNRQMTADLEAAARVQRAQLPVAPLRFPGGMFHAFFRPSRVVAGDTYDCVTLPDGRSRIFQIDVSGHGAPAALVSIASHIALKQALLAAAPAEPMAAIIARINRNWAEDLPYFTLLAVEIDPAAARAHIVQCGHPPLVRLSAAGGLEPLGDGGLPIGVLPDASFTTLDCPFRPGDRLVLATDGVTETADPDGGMFGDTRFRDILAHHATRPVPTLFDRLERALWDWRGSEILEDDITILVLESI